MPLSSCLLALVVVWLACCWCGALPLVSAAGHLPRAYLPPSQAGDFYGNSNRPDALLEIAAFADRLLSDSVQLPFTRSIVNATQFGAVPDDGQDDWVGLNDALQYACALTKKRLAALSPAEARALSALTASDPDARPVLVELRFEPGSYDLGGGLDGVDHCSYLLWNGQNSTILSHFEPGFSSHNFSTSRSELLYCDTCRFIYLYSLVFSTALPAVTMGRVHALIRDQTDTVVGVELRAAPHHPVWSADSALLQHVGPDGEYLHWSAAHTRCSQERTQSSD